MRLQVATTSSPPVAPAPATSPAPAVDDAAAAVGLGTPVPRRWWRDRSWAAGILEPQALRTALTSSKTGAGGPMMLWSWMSGGSPSEKAPRAPSAPRCRCRCRSGEAGAVDICGPSRRSSPSMQLVQQIADRSVAAVGVWRAESFAYGIAAERRGRNRVPFLLGVDLGRPARRSRRGDRAVPGRVERDRVASADRAGARRRGRCTPHGRSTPWRWTPRCRCRRRRGRDLVPTARHGGAGRPRAGRGRRRGAGTGRAHARRRTAASASLGRHELVAPTRRP